VGGTGVAVGSGGAQEATTAPTAATADNRRKSRRVISRFIFLSSFGNHRSSLDLDVRFFYAWNLFVAPPSSSVWQ
jgi:hypothetical protein